MSPSKKVMEKGYAAVMYIASKQRASCLTMSKTAITIIIEFIAMTG